MQKFTKIRGYWKFRDETSHDELLKYAEELAADERYSDVHLRAVSKDQTGLGFTYDNGDEPLKVFSERQTDFLKRRFGNGLAGWDLAGSYEQIK
jgi:hypothetical protein